jgi:hypothetical protein
MGLPFTIAAISEGAATLSPVTAKSRKNTRKETHSPPRHRTYRSQSHHACFRDLWVVQLTGKRSYLKSLFIEENQRVVKDYPEGACPERQKPPHSERSRRYSHKEVRR